MLLFSGTISNYAKRLELKTKWQMRKNNNFEPVQTQKDIYAQQIRDSQKSNYLTAITNKLKSGKRLSVSELDYLRRESPQLYQEALNAAREREEYREQLKDCKTKDDVLALKTQKLTEFMSTINTIGNNPNISDAEKLKQFSYIQMRMNGCEAETEAFLKEEGAGLKWQHEIDAEEKREEEAAIEEEMKEIEEAEKAEETQKTEKTDTENKTEETESADGKVESDTIPKAEIVSGKEISTQKPEGANIALAETKVSANNRRKSSAETKVSAVTVLDSDNKTERRARSRRSPSSISKSIVSSAILNPSAAVKSHNVTVSSTLMFTK